MGGWWCGGEDGWGGGGEELWSGRAAFWEGGGGWRMGGCEIGGGDGELWRGSVAFLGGRRWVEDGGVVKLGLAMRAAFWEGGGGE